MTRWRRRRPFALKSPTTLDLLFTTTRLRLVPHSEEFGSGPDRQDVGPSDQEAQLQYCTVPKAPGTRHQAPGTTSSAPRACGRADRDDTSLGYDRQNKPDTSHPMAGLRRPSYSTVRGTEYSMGTYSMRAEVTTSARAGINLRRTWSSVVRFQTLGRRGHVPDG